MSRVGDKGNPLLGGTDLSSVKDENPRKTYKKPGGSGINLYSMNFSFFCY